MVEQRMMRAVVQDGYGPYERLTIGEVPIPEPGDDEIRIRVLASSVHADVWHAVTALPFVLRFFGNGISRPKQPVPGTDLCGIVDIVGSGVTTFEVGDRVYGEPVAAKQWISAGTLAEYATAPAASMHPVPEGITDEEAASLPTSAVIALEVLRGEASIQPADTVLINGAGGAVGVHAVQIAKAMGAEVTAVDRADKLPKLSELGADHVIDFQAEDFTTNGIVYDVVLDIASNRPFDDVKESVKPEGNYVLVGHAGYSYTKRRWIGEVGTFARLMARSPFDERLKLGSRQKDPPPMEAVAALVETGELKGVVAATFPLDQVVSAMQLVTSGDATGRVVISMAADNGTDNAA
ncbi:MAG: NAD(P)-dependent alcohol dehydrogenase [Acidimicrobiia bacterium]